MRVLGTGPGEFPGFVLLHGVGMSHHSLLPLGRSLSAQHAVRVFDLPGFAGVPRPAGTLTVEAMADAVAGSLRAVQAPPAVVVGHSMGVQWAIELAARHADLVAGLVLIGPVVDAERRTLRAQALALGRDSLREPPHVNARVLWDYLRSDTRWFFAQARRMRDYPTERRVTAIDVPILLVRGDRDPIARQEWVDALAARSGAAVVVVPGQSHHAQFAAPAATAAAILDFVSTTVRR